MGRLLRPWQAGRFHSFTLTKGLITTSQLCNAIKQHKFQLYHSRRFVVQLLRALNVRVVVIAVTDHVNKDEINAIADDPDDANTFFVDDFSNLSNVVANIALAACGRGIDCFCFVDIILLVGWLVSQAVNN